MGDNSKEWKVLLPCTIREACLQASSFLAGQGVEEPRNNAELLLQHLLGIGRMELLRDGGDPFPSELAPAWDELTRRKGNGEPVQYIIGEQWFYSRPFAVTPAVLIPRPETELLVEAVLEAADRLWPESAQAEAEGAPAEGAAEAGFAAASNSASEQAEQEGGSAIAADRAKGLAARPTVLDVGTGSGAIGVTLAVLRPLWRVCASDLSPDALAVARTNAACHGAAGRMAFVQGDLLAPFIGTGGAAAAQAPGAVDLRVDVLVSNPPYIPADDLPGLQREVRDYEPHLALDGGADGLDPYRRMVEQLPLLRQMPRIVAFELGMGQAEAVAELLRKADMWDEVRTITDYGGIDRHVIAVRTNG
ncbi:N5-glutamine methyltransferase family protein [Paenibacillus sp. Leaf72]|uniref:N5-glutamine methyltransferase family protein n=1 Tax=Paenibacillus sp. Leaf72 TaxID=1736234 RepID=UPI0006FE67F9|nr:HemK/PrmC family methyltransferase [Paenibacillus sp. Leaf72]KQO10936.1 protein-(glutamine-N5) methyltransferase, release factor-specific [Paenibacillus sp. Leaf72]